MLHDIFDMMVEEEEKLCATPTGPITLNFTLTMVNGEWVCSSDNKDNYDKNCISTGKYINYNNYSSSSTLISYAYPTTVTGVDTKNFPIYTTVTV